MASQRLKRWALRNRNIKVIRNGKRLQLTIVTIVVILASCVLLSRIVAEQRALHIAVGCSEPLKFLGVEFGIFPTNGPVWIVRFDPVNFFATFPFDVYVSPTGSIIETSFSNDLTLAMKKHSNIDSTEKIEGAR